MHEGGAHACLTAPATVTAVNPKCNLYKLSSSLGGDSLCIAHYVRATMTLRTD